MRRTFAFSLALLAATLLVSSPALADRRGPKAKPGVSRSCPGCKGTFRPNTPPRHVRPSHAMPKIHKPKAKVESWGVETTWHPVPNRGGGGRHVNRDPWKAELSGYNEGSKVKIQTQTKSKDVALPTGCVNCKVVTAKKGKKITNPRKLARKERSKAWRSAVSKAQNWETQAEVNITVNSHKETQTHQAPAVMPTHTPMRITGKDTFGRKYGTVHTNVAGMKTQAQNTQRETTINGRRVRQGGTISNSGLHVPAYEAWANTKNVYVTPAYGDRGQEQVKMLGLAAFPAGAKITVTNMRLKSEGVANHTATFVANKSGSGGIAVSALQNDKLQVSVSYDAVADRAQAANHSFTVRVPRASGKPAIKARGIRYMSVDLVE